MEPIEYRKEQPAPTEPGWYWARLKSSRAPKPPLEPVYCHPQDELAVSSVLPRAGYSSLSVIDGWEWFGPIMEIREG